MPGNPVLLAFGSESCEAVRIFPLVVLLPLAPVAARTATVSTAERVSHPLHPDPTPRFARGLMKFRSPAVRDATMRNRVCLS